MKKIFQLCAVLAVMFAVTGCYNDFDAPKPAKVYTDEDFAGMKHISIADVKQMCLDEHKSLGGTGCNSSWGDTKLRTDRPVARRAGLLDQGQGAVERRGG